MRIKVEEITARANRQAGVPIEAPTLGTRPHPKIADILSHPEFKLAKKK